MPAAIPVRVQEIRELGERALRIRLVPCGRANLPAFRPGAHLQIQLPNGLLRCYSLCSDPRSRDHYDIAVGFNAASRGGSAYLFDALAEDDVFLVSEPVGGFGIQPDGERHLFVAGGIGITPFVAMAHALNATGVPYVAHYAVRDRRAVPEELLAPFGERMVLYPAAEGRRLDLDRLLSTTDSRAVYYFCGPPRMLSEAHRLTSCWPAGRACFESFAGPPSGKVAAGEPFTARVRSSGQVIAVPPRQTLLECLRSAGHAIGSSCEHGVCGSCRIRYLGGKPLHRDAILRDDERALWLTPCVSRGDGELLLDL